MFDRAQGTIEYLVIIAVVIVISLIVVGLVITQVDNSSNVSGTASEIGTKIGVGGLSLASSVIGADTNGLLVIKNIDAENLTLSKIIVDGVDHNFSDGIVAGEEKSFKLIDVASCDRDKKNYSVKVEYISASGLTKVSDFGNIPLECTTVVTPAKFAVEEIISVSAVDCTGGNITYNGGYTIHTFLSSGTLECTSNLDAEVLVVAGGGGGGDNAAAGGGGGGLIYDESYALTFQDYTVTVGSGGLGATSPGKGTDGGNSVFSTLTAIGGGAGGGLNGSTPEGPSSVGNSGGSGGGSAGKYGTAYYFPDGGAGAAGQGNNGGKGAVGPDVPNSGVDAGGGGGAGANGNTGNGLSPGLRGNGGVGLQYSISGSNTYYAGGGGGGTTARLGTYATGGLGGGGNGGARDGHGSAGTANTGGGGGGGGSGSVAGRGGAGGSGIVIVRYLTN